MVMGKRIRPRRCYKILRKISQFPKYFAALCLFIIIGNALVYFIFRPKTHVMILRNHDVLKESKVRKKLPSLCPNINSLHNQDSSLYDGVACKPRAPPKEACKYTAKMFKIKPSILVCKNKDGEVQLSYDLCNVSDIHTVNQSTQVKVTCDLSACDSGRDIIIEELDPLRGELQNKKANGEAQGSKETFENLVEKALLRARENNFNFVYLTCTSKRTNTTISQMISLLPKLQFVQSSARKPPGRKLNVNFVLLDSISRAHFYRSFPNSVEYLREKRNKKQPKAASFFEFQFFQAIQDYTFQNEYVLFNGRLCPANLTRSMCERKSTNPQIFYGIFKQAGYQTLVLEDVCWKSGHGIRGSLKAENWPMLQTKMRTSNVDSTGITHSSCKILTLVYGSHIAFQFKASKYHQTCFNGRHQHEYLLNYLSRYVKTVESNPQSKPFISYTAMKVSHDNIGLRVQTLDKHIMEFIDTMSKQEDTITFIISDHGNSYTRYQWEMLEGRLEKFNPMMIAIIPHKAGQLLGDEVLNNLRVNQHRLFTLLDLRAALVEVSKFEGNSKFKPAGLLDSISRERLCSDLQLRKGSVCVCAGFDVPVENSTLQVLIAQFAIGQLNNKIQDSLMKSENQQRSMNRSHFLFENCQRLRIQKFANMRERTIKHGWISATIDINVQTGNIVKQKEVFTVNVEYKKSANGSLEMELRLFERVSTYGFYEQCADRHVSLKLCVCNKISKINKSTKLDLMLNRTRAIYETIGVSADIRNVSSCLVLIQRSHHSTTRQKKQFLELKIYEMANICDSQSFNVHVDVIDGEQITSSAKLPMMLTLAPRTLYFVTGLKAEGHYEQKLNLRIRIV